MARIDLWAFLHMDQNSFRKMEKEAAGRFEKMGQSFGESQARGYEKAAPRLRRAINTVTEATVAQSRATRAQSQAQSDATARAIEAEKAEKKHAEAKRVNTELTEKLRRAEYSLGTGRSTLGGATGELTDSERELAQLRKDVEKSTRELEKAEKDAARVRRDAAKANEDAIRRNEDLERSNRRLEESHRRVREAEEASSRSRRRGGGSSTVGNVLSDIPGVPGGRAGAVIGTGVLTVLASAAEAAVTASQALALIPAAAAAAGAGMATLAIGTAGFGDSVKNMGDPKKFAEALQSLSPAAQQAALEIKALVDGPLGELKKATQDALFKDVAPMLKGASDIFAPVAQNLTTSLATSFNNMFANGLGQLEAPKSLTMINEIVNNITNSFHLLEPAIAPFVDAILKITQTGSSFLPQLAQSITNAATAFDNFITKAQANGDLSTFIQKGIDAAKALGSFLFDLGRRIYEVFGNKSPEEFRATLEATANTIMSVIQAIVGAAHAVNDFFTATQPVTDALGGWGTIASTALGVFVGAKMIGALGNITKMASGLGEGAGVAGQLRAIPALATAAFAAMYEGWKKLEDAFPWLKTGGGRAAALGATAPNPFLQVLGPFANTDTTSAQDKAQAALDEAKRQAEANGSPKGPAVQGPGISNNPNSADYKQWYPAQPSKPGDWSPLPVPSPPPPGGEKGLLDSIKAKMDPNSFMPNIGPPPDLSASGQPQKEWGNGGEPFAKDGYGYWDKDPRQIQEAYQRIVREARDVRDAEMDLAALRQSGIATQLDILHAEEKAQEQKDQLQKSQLDYAEAQQGKWKKLSDSMSSLGSLGLDSDLGISKGLGGLAENLVKFVGSLALAPLKAMIGPKDPNSGSGIIGMLLGGNRTSPSEPATQSRDGWSGTYSGDAALLSKVPAGRYTQDQRGDLTQGLADCSSAVEDLVNIMDGKPTSGASMWTGNADQWLTEHGFVPGMGGPGDFRVGFNSSHMQATLPGGTPFNWGSDAAAARRGIGGTGADDPSFTNHYYRPANSLGEFSSSGGAPVPVNVVNASSILGGLNWDALAAKESSGNWQANTGNGYYGGLQFDQPTWDAYKGAAGVDVARPDLATREQQIAVGQQAYNARGGGQSLWPQNYGQLQTPVLPPTAPLPPLPPPGSFPGGGGGPGSPFGNFPSGFGLGGPPASPQAPGPSEPRTPDWYLTHPGERAPGEGTPGANNPLSNLTAPLGATPGAPSLGNSAGFSPAYKPQAPSQAPPGGWKPDSKGGVGIGGGLLGAAMQAGASGASAMAGPLGPVASMGMQMAMQLADRSVKYGSQVAGIAVQGLIDTFTGLSDPDGGSGPNLGDSLPGRLIKGLAGAGADIGAGAISAGMADKQADKKKDPNAQQQQDQQGNVGKQAGGGLHIENMNVQGDRKTGQKIANDLHWASANAQMGR